MALKPSDFATHCNLGIFQSIFRKGEKMMRRLGAHTWIASVLAGLGLLFLIPATGLAQPSLLIGHSACLSGDYAEAGQQAVNGIKACVQWVNEEYGGVTIDGQKYKLKYKTYDCASKKKNVPKLIQKLINQDNADVIFAPYSSGLTLHGAPVAEKHDMLYMDHGGANNKIFEQGFEYIVQTIGPATSYHKGTLEMLKQIAPASHNRVALAYEDSEFARMVMEGAENHAENLGFDVVFKDTYSPDVKDLTPLLQEMKKSDPDIVLGGGHFEDGELFCRQLAEMDFDVKALSLIASVTLPAFYDAMAERTDLSNKAKGVIGPSHWEMGVTYSEKTAEKKGLPWIGPSQEDFVWLFKQNVGEDMDPDYHAAEAGASVLAYVLGVEQAGSADPDKVRSALGNLEFMSFYGGWDINEKGMQVGHTMINVQWQDAHRPLVWHDGERAIIWPEGAQTSAPVYPLPSHKE